jgi:REP element-mobilizing transposase RayT
MQRIPRRSGRTKWCHVVWPTVRDRELFKIPAAARFCERIIRSRCKERGWLVDTVVFTTDRVHLLVRSPAELSRRAIIRRMQGLTKAALRRARIVDRWDRRMWDHWAWCSILTSPAAIAAVRRWLVARRAIQLGGWDWRWEVGGRREAGRWGGGEWEPSGREWEPTGVRGQRLRTTAAE